MKNTLRLLVTGFMLSCSCLSAAEIIVVANTDSEHLSLEKRQVRDIFMKNNSHILLDPVVLAPNIDARFLFNTKIVGLTESRIQSYWAQMRFTGRKKPPKEFVSLQAMLEYVQSNKNTVAYLPGNMPVPLGLTVVYQAD